MRRIEPRQPQGEVEPTICQTETAEQTASRLVLLTRSPRMEHGLRYFLNFRADVIQWIATPPAAFSAAIVASPSELVEIGIPPTTVLQTWPGQEW